MKQQHSARKTRHSWKKALLGLVALGFIFAGGMFVWASLIKLPDISSFQARKIANSSKITDRTGEVVLYDIHQSVRRTEIPLEEMSDNIKNGVIAIEDAHFYEHKGVRPTSIIRALVVDVINRDFSQGGSTITQQIVKNTLLTGDKTITRKFKEWILALKLERHFTKDQILQIYLNDAPFGSTIYGVEEASQAFFTKKTKDLTVAEAAYLTAMIPAPSYYSPFGKHRDALDTRKNLVLKKMNEYGYIDDEQYQQALAETVAFNAGATNSIKAPHFVFYILDQLQQKYGKDVMESGGYTIRTTLDYDLQLAAEAAIKEHAEGNLSRYGATNSALVAIDPTSGQILAMVGSKDYFSEDIDGAFNVAVAERQPGSSFKPFVYATAFAKGYTPDTILFDVPTEFNTECPVTADGTDEECYHPSNFDDKFKGPMTLRSALGESRNVPSVKLLYLTGLDDVLATGKALGLTTLREKDHYGLSLVLGGGEVTLLDMVGAYGVFANSGVRNPTTGVLAITERDGSVIEEFEAAPIEAFDRNAALTLNQILSDPAARAPTFGSSITIPGVAVKTGTTNDNRDAWIIGYTPNLAVGVWSGNNRNEPMRSGGSAISGPTLMTYLRGIIEDEKLVVAPFEEPIPEEDKNALKPILRGVWMGNRTVEIDRVTGLLATEHTPRAAREERVITDVQDTLYWVDKDDPRGPAPSNPEKDPQFHLWNPPVQQWWQEHMSEYNITTDNDLPSSFENVHTGEEEKITFSGLPKDMDLSDTRTVTLRYSGSRPLVSADVFVDGDLLVTLSAPFRFSFSPEEYDLKKGSHTFTVTATDSIFGRHTGAQTVQFN